MSKRTTTYVQKLQYNTNSCTSETPQVNFTLLVSTKKTAANDLHLARLAKITEMKNHFSIACRLNKILHRIHVNSDSSDFYSLYAVRSKHGKKWYVKGTMGIEGNSEEVSCQLDSGSTCNVISNIDYATLV